MFRKFPFKTKIILAQNIIILFVVILLGSIYYHKVLSTISESMLDDFRIVSDSIVEQSVSYTHLTLPTICSV